MANQNHAQTLGFKPVNRRFPEQWRIISKHIDFKGKEVLDLGCGQGDMLAAVWKTGGLPLGVEVDKNIIINTNKRLLELGVSDLLIIEKDIEDLQAGQKFDIITCFSVLPYITTYGTLRWIAAHGDLALLEIQYAGDGPGIIKGDDEMIAILSEYWNDIKAIGRTLVDYRNTWRTIWMCSAAHS